MRLAVKQGNRAVNEFQFSKGPIYIGRHANSQVFLPDRGISRQHAVIFNTQDGKWVVEDLDSASKTYLNDEQIHKADIKTGDIVRIVDFTIEIDLEDSRTVEKPIDLDDTLAKSPGGPQIIARDLDTAQAPPIKFPAERAKDFMEATDLIGKAGSIDELLVTLLNITAKQFDSANVWCALRPGPGGPMTAHAGKNRNGEAIQLGEIKLNDKITQSVDKNQFLLFVFSRIPGQAKEGDIRSAVISPIVGSAGCFGVVYADNAIGDDHYSITDLDYLMLLGIHTTTVLTSL